jgi:hypothetical protein
VPRQERTVGLPYVIARRVPPDGETGLARSSFCGYEHC